MDSFSGLPLTRASVLEAHKLVAPHVHRTPVLRCRALDEFASGERAPGGARPAVRLWFKCENLQRVGAFKARGAFHAVGRLVEGEWKGGVVTHSSGVFLSCLMTWPGCIRALLGAVWCESGASV